MTIPVRGCDPPANSGSGCLLRWQGCVHVVGLWRHFLIVVQVNGSLHVALCTVFMPTVRAADEVLDQQPQGHPNHEQHHQAHNDHHVHLWSCPRQLVWTYTTRSTNSSLQNWGEMQYTVQANSNNNKNPVWYVWVWVSFKSTPHNMTYFGVHHNQSVYLCNTIWYIQGLRKCIMTMYHWPQHYAWLQLTVLTDLQQVTEV